MTEMFSLLGFQQDVCYHSSVFANASGKGLEHRQGGQAKCWLLVSKQTECSARRLHTSRDGGVSRNVAHAGTCTHAHAHTRVERPRVPSQSPVLSYRVLSDTRSKSGRRAANCEAVTMTALPPILETGPWRPDGAPSAEVGLSRGRGLCADEPAVKAPFSSPEPRAEAEQERIQQGQETASVGPGPVPREGD